MIPPIAMYKARYLSTKRSPSSQCSFLDNEAFVYSNSLSNMITLNFEISVFIYVTDMKIEIK
ncbi:hypothetical protein J1TS3_04540 [Siminovitchia fordii]|uniref:Uncharacterized protein n=1 Tax=Siminovitchia fordii TaxID=254759 RepID=A0ABQ4K2E8_9BACI|nr:hypothetical protein J1TS3_04540 [Siminovitchia fordii]